MTDWPSEWKSENTTNVDKFNMKILLALQKVSSITFTLNNIWKTQKSQWEKWMYEFVTDWGTNKFIEDIENKKTWKNLNLWLTEGHTRSHDISKFLDPNHAVNYRPITLALFFSLSLFLSDKLCREHKFKYCQWGPNLHTNTYKMFAIFQPTIIYLCLFNGICIIW